MTLVRIIANEVIANGAVTSLHDILSLEIETPAACWAHGLSIPIHVDATVPMVRTCVLVRLGRVAGRIRIGLLNPEGSDYISSKILSDVPSATVGLTLTASGGAGPLVVQNLSHDGASRFVLDAIDVMDQPPYPTERDDLLTQYMREGFNAVEGWCHYLNIAFLRGMDEALYANGVDGGIGEIGVHHGKQFIALHNMMPPDAKSLAIDVFDSQEFNLDRSGEGDRNRFEGNLAKWAGSPGNCIVVQRDSLALRPRDLDELYAEVGPLKMFSIDGCHSIEHTLSDMQSAISLIADGGIVVLDDYLNPDFPGVHQGIAYLFLRDRPGIAPFVIGQNKLYLAHVSHSERYLAAARVVMNQLPETKTVQCVRMYGYDVLSWRSAEAGWDYPVS